jgi:hypothetical protein
VNLVVAVFGGGWGCGSSSGGYGGGVVVEIMEVEIAFLLLSGISS